MITVTALTDIPLVEWGFLEYFQLIKYQFMRKWLSATTEEWTCLGIFKNFIRIANISFNKTKGNYITC